MSYYTERDRVLRALRLSCPTRFYAPVSETFSHLIGIRAVCTVDFNTSRNGNETENIISIDGITAFGQFKFQSFQILVDNKYVLFRITSFYLILQVIPFSAAIGDFIVRITFTFLQFGILIQ